MSKLQKLLISGIRSFQNDAGQTIAFETPLTLIVGTNGSGKTTIIECLKYAATGELPPNSKGGAFVHDPQLVGEKEVKAQVRLQFVATNGAKMASVRNILLTVKKTKRQQSTLECNLVMQRQGERVSVSKRVADLDRLIPEYLGASTAILDYVIFCHQDESLWPLSEPSALKKRFDEIFEAQKYIKAIDNIKALRKQQRIELGKQEITEAHAKQDKMKAQEAKYKKRMLLSECEAMAEEIEKLDAEASSVQKELSNAWERTHAYTKTEEELRSKRKQEEILQDHLRRLEVDFEARSESNEELQRELDEYEDGLQVLEVRRREQMQLYEKARENIKEAQERQSSKRTEAGKYEQQQANHNQRLSDRDADIKRAAREHGIRGFDMDLDDMQVNEFMEKIMKMSKDHASKVERQRNENLHEMSKVQEVLDNLREKRSALQEARRAAKEQMDKNNDRIAALRSQLEKSTVDEGSVVALETKIEELDSKVAEAQQKLAKIDCVAKSKEFDKDIQEREDVGAALNRELIEGTKQASDLARLEHLKKEAKDRERRLESMTHSHDAVLKALIGQQWQSSKLEIEFNQVLKNKQTKVSDAQRQREGISRELDHVEFRLKTVQKDIKQKEDERASCVTFIREKLEDDAAEPDDYPVELAGAQNDRDTRQTDVDGYTYMEQFFKDSIHHIRTKKECRLCRSSLDGANRKEEVISSIQRQFGDAKRRELEQNLQDAKDDLLKLESAGPYYDTWKRLSEKDLPPLQYQATELKQKYAVLARQVEEHDQNVAEAESSQKDAEMLSKPVQAIIKYQEELITFSKQIKQIESEKSVAGSSRTLDDIREQMEAVKSQERDLRKKQSKVQDEDRETRDHINKSTQERADAKNRLTKVQHELQEKASINSQIVDLKETNQEKKSAIKSFGNQLDASSPQLSEHSEKLDQIRSQGREMEKELQKEASRLSDDVHGLMRVEREIQSYIRGGGAAKLTVCREEISALGTEVSTLEAELKRITVELSKIQKQLDKQDHTKRVIVDNFNYRKYESELEEISKEIETLARQIDTADRDDWRQKAERLQRRFDIVNTKKQRSLGEKAGKDAELGRVAADIDNNAAAAHREARVKLEATKAAIEDLGKYSVALDNAVMRFHSIKMEQINRSIEELWKATYQGTDVDSILIRSDNEIPNAKKDSDRRSYSYRVCMIKDGVEMDMRGRCSAGQKVLASIIIRLALAECFGDYCGLIALDEPTTNLDRDNIESLAKSLAGIVEQRQKQSNFQIIIITHDEEFLRYMQCSDFCDNYYRVYRDDKQKSKIVRQRISDVM